MQTALVAAFSAATVLGAQTPAPAAVPLAPATSAHPTLPAPAPLAAPPSQSASSGTLQAAGSPPQATVPANKPHSAPSANAPSANAPSANDAPGNTPAPPGSTVLFERHDPEATGTAPEAESPDTDSATGQGAAGVSSSTRSHRSLQRRAGMAAASTTDAEAPPMPDQERTGVSTSADPAASTFAAASELTSPAALKAGLPPLDTKAAEAISDTERTAPHLLTTDLDLHLNRDIGDLAARARVVVRNSGPTPLSRMVLEISSALRWQSASLVSVQGSQRLTLEQHGLTTDADHTGAATEVAVTLPSPLAPGAAITLDLFYGGKLTASGERLVRLGAPASRALASDWDIVSPSFVGLRGFGNVLWYPVAAPPALLATGDSFARVTDEQRRRGAASRIGLRLTLESSGPAPEAAFFNSRRMALTEVGQPTAPAGQTPSASPVQSAATPSGQPAAPSENADEEPATRLFTAVWTSMPLGDHLPSLFVSDRPSPNAEDTGALLHIATTSNATAARYTAAAQRLRPFLEEWLGPHRGDPLEVLELPAGATQPFADGSLLVVPVSAATEDTADAQTANGGEDLATTLVYPLGSSFLPQGAAPWLVQGLPEFLRLVHLERQEGRERALATLHNGLSALQDQEALPSAPLRECANPICARTKAAFAFTMLRQLTGDDTLKAALPALIAQPGTTPDQASSNLEVSLQRISGKDLHWFFADWFDRDAGLPELTIVTVAPRRIERGSVHTVVPTERRPVAGPVGPEPVAQPNGPLDQERPTQASRNGVALADGSWLVAVEVRNNGDAAAEVPVTLRSGSLQNSMPLRVPAHGRATIRVPFETAPDEVLVNDGTTPEQRSTTHRRRIEVPAQAR